MSLTEKINNEIKDAMRAKDTVKLTTLRSVKAALLEKEISIRQGGTGELTEENELQVLVGLAKKRKESIEQFQAAGRTDLVEKETAELNILNVFLPKPLSDDDVKNRLKEIIAETGALSMKDIGKVMPLAMKEFKGKADGKFVQDSLKALLEQ